MKQTLVRCTCLLIFLALSLGLVSCGGGKVQSPIVFNKRYIGYNMSDQTFDEETYYVFHADQTGYCEYKYVYTGAIGGHTLSGRIEFEWRETSDGTVYLFKTKTHYHEDHTQGMELGIINGPICFSEEFFTPTEVGGRYVLEGSDLAKKLTAD